jgi:hypothetical protein
VVGGAVTVATVWTAAPVVGAGVVIGCVAGLEPVGDLTALWVVVVGGFCSAPVEPEAFEPDPFEPEAFEPEPEPFEPEPCEPEPFEPEPFEPEPFEPEPPPFVIPAPNSWPELELPAGAPRAVASGIEYSLAAGLPGSTWTPGGSLCAPAAAGIESAVKKIRSAPRRGS